MTLKTFAFTCALLLQSEAYSSPLFAGRDSTIAQPTHGIEYKGKEVLQPEKPIPLLAGVSVSADVCGAGMALFGKYGQYEGAARVNLRGRFFPIVEVGVGVSDYTNDATEMHYKVHAPYFRVGMDYNFLKNRRSHNRIFAGLRYGCSVFNYDLDGPDIVDATYGSLTPFHFTGLKGRNHWGEAVVGVEAQVWGILHLGWSFRYRLRLANKESAVGSPWYVPGYGKNDTSAIGGTFNVIFDI